MDVPRTPPDQVRRELASDGTVELVCAYDDEDKCRGMLIEGAETMTHFRARLENVSRDRRIILYCA